MKNDQLGQRFKYLEDNSILPKKQTYVIRLDGKSFSTLTKHLQPCSVTLHQTLVETAKRCCEEIQGSLLAYIQSDEISIVCSNKQSEETQHWFGGKIQKIVSISAAMFTGYFNKTYCLSKLAIFDSRVHSISDEDVPLYLIWRQLDCIRNSINKIGSIHFSKKELFKKTQTEVKLMLSQKGAPWESCFNWFKFGTLLLRDETNKFMQVDNPECIQELSFIPQYLESILKYTDKKQQLSFEF